jgi:4-amino-4-deoxy-L-arabinose transferase-like glycosyltransferase
MSDNSTNVVRPIDTLHRLALGGAGVGLLAAAILFPGAAVGPAWGGTLFRILLAGHGLLLAVLATRPGRRGPAGTPPPGGQEEAGGFPGRRAAGVLLAALVVASLALRLWRLDSGLWLDEVLTLTQYARPPLATILTSFPDQNQHMLYSVLAHLSLTAFGESAWALRLPAVFFGAGGVWALYLLGKQVTNRAEALLAAALMTVSYHHVWFSQNARGYTGLLFFTLWSTGLFVRGLREGRWGTWVWYAVSVALGFWVHMTMLFVVLSHSTVYAALLVASFRTGALPAGTRWRPFLAMTLAATLTLQLYALSLPQFLASALHEVSLPSEWTDPVWVVRETLAGLRLGFAGVAGVAVGGALFLAGLVSIGRRDRTFIALLVLPGLLGGLCMLLLHHNLWPRFFFYCAGYAFLVFVRGTMVAAEAVARALRTEAQAQRAGAVAVLLMAVGLAAVLPRCYRLPKQDYVGARSFVEARRQPGEPVVAVGLAGLSYGSYYAPAWPTPGTRPELDEIRRGAETTWLVYTFPPHLRAFCPDLWDAVQDDFEVVEVFPGSLNAGEIYVCRSRPAARALSPTWVDRP